VNVLVSFFPHFDHAVSRLPHHHLRAVAHKADATRAGCEA
jgi:hypothetical protein